MDRKKLFKTLLYLILFILIVNFFATKFYWYSAIWYFDMIMHFLGGFWVGLVVLYFFIPKEISLRLILTILFWVFFVGIGWEMFEVLVDKVITQNSSNILDTVSDIFFDLVGGLSAILYRSQKIMPAPDNTV